MENETNSNLSKSGQSPIEKKTLPGDGELQEDELDEVSGGNMKNLKLVTEMASEVSKMHFDILQAIARNTK